MLGGFDRGSFTPFPSLDVKLWKEIRGQGSVFIDYNKRAYSVEEPSEDFRDLAHSEKTEPFPRASSTIQLRDIRTLSLFNFWQSLSRHQPGWQICHYTTSATSTRLISSFFGVFFPAVLNDSLYQCQSDPRRSSVCLWSCSRSTSAFGRNPLLSRRTWKAHTVPSRDRQHRLFVQT